MYRKLSAFSIVLASLSLAACSAPVPAPTPSLSAPSVPKPAEEASQPSPSSTSKTSDRGYLIKGMGEAAAYLNEFGEAEVNFRVDWIKANAKCGDPYFPPVKKGMKRIEVHLTVETTKAMKDSQYRNTVTFSPFLWKYIDKNGQTYGGEIYAADGVHCESKKNPLPDEFGPSEKGQGWIMFDVPDLEGTLIYNQGFEYDLAKALKEK